VGENEQVRTRDARAEPVQVAVLATLDIRSKNVGYWWLSPFLFLGISTSSKWREGFLDAVSFLMLERISEVASTPLEQECLAQFLQILANLRPYLIQCSHLEGFPRTNNDTERGIRGLKTRYRRISGRKNGNSYLIRYGRCVALYEWWEQEPERFSQLEQQLRGVTPERWRQVHQQTTIAQSEQLKRFRFHRKREIFLASLETRWTIAAQSVLLL
jgi:hypothetical protein